MATHKSAKKRARQDLKRRARNRHVLATMRTAVKKFQTSLAGGDAEDLLAKTRMGHRHQGEVAFPFPGDRQRHQRRNQRRQGAVRRQAQFGMGGVSRASTQAGA